MLEQLSPKEMTTHTLSCKDFMSYGAPTTGTQPKEMACCSLGVEHPAPIALSPGELFRWKDTRIATRSVNDTRTSTVS